MEQAERNTSVSPHSEAKRQPVNHLQTSQPKRLKQSASVDTRSVSPSFELDLDLQYTKSIQDTFRKTVVHEGNSIIGLIPFKGGADHLLAFIDPRLLSLSNEMTQPTYVEGSSAHVALVADGPEDYRESGHEATWDQELTTVEADGENALEEIENARNSTMPEDKAGNVEPECKISSTSVTSSSSSPSRSPQPNFPYAGYLNIDSTFFGWTANGKRMPDSVVIQNPDAPVNTEAPRNVEDHVLNPQLWLNNQVRLPKSWPESKVILSNTNHILYARMKDGPCLMCKQPAMMIDDMHHCKCDVRLWRNQRRRLIGNNLYLKEVSQQIGTGVFTAMAIPEGQVLGDFVGELVPSRVWDSQIDGYLYVITAETDQSRLVASPRVLGYIDASKFGNWTRFINHDCESPNVYVQERRVGEVRVFAVHSTKHIQSGQELLAHYGDECFVQETRYRTRDTKKTVTRVCACGSAHCRYPVRGQPPQGELEDVGSATILLDD